MPSAPRALPLAFTALGVVFGDIGTSPLYALRECFSGRLGIVPTHENGLGILSLVFWALALIVCVKYVVVVLRADNRGEGGILALLASLRLPPPDHEGRLHGRTLALVLMGVFGAALFYGDGLITPAISVLSAVEGLTVATHGLERVVVPVALVILLTLFALQSRGTASMGALFAPVTLVWMLTLATLGLYQIVQAPQVLAAIVPTHAVRFLLTHGGAGFLVLGAVLLVVTGAEALYADMGHFGARPIRLAWFGLVFPALVLNYFGQGALLLRSADAVANPFYLMAPTWTLVPLIILATLATVIASQAAISGAFSLARQAAQLGYLPRMEVRHTSPTAFGQIYVPKVNLFLAMGTATLVLGFSSSAALANAYGVAVATTMLITSVLLFTLVRRRWRWSAARSVLVIGGFLVVDGLFWGATMMKVLLGGWLPLAVALGLMLVMTTWRSGRVILERRMQCERIPITGLLDILSERPPARVEGVGVYMTPMVDAAPPALMRNLAHNKVLHQDVVFLTIAGAEVPRVADESRLELTEVGPGIHRMVAHYGFMETPDAPEALRLAVRRGLDVPLDDVTYFLGRERVLSRAGPGGMAAWRERLFAFLTRNAEQATAYFRLPPDQVVELGAHVRL